MQSTSVEGFRLSLQQARLWSLQPPDHSSPYRAQGTVRISGPLDRARLTAACDALIAGQEILRTTYQTVRGMSQPLQVIGDSQLRWLPDQDLSGLSAQEQAAQIEQLRDMARARPLDLTHGPSGELLLLRCASEEHVLLITISALNTDADTLKLFALLLAQHYTSASSDADPPEAPLQYADFADWQRDILESEDAPDRSIWQRFSTMPLHTARMPFDTTIPGRSVFQPRALPVALSPALRAQLDALSEQLSTPRATVLLACWQLLLSRLTAQPELLLGLACSGRMYEDLNAAFGLFATYVPLAAQMPADASLGDFVAQVTASHQAAIQAQESWSWDEFTGQAGTDHEAAFFPWCFMSVELPAPAASGPTEFALTQLAAITERFKAQLVVTETQTELELAIQYDASVFDEPEIRQLTQRLQTLLEQIVARPNTPLHALTLVGPDERQELLVGRNNTHATYPDQACLHQLIAAQAERTPEALAVSDGTRQLCYAELDAQANQLARQLQRLGVQGEVRVAICTTRSVELLVGLLGILKAGAAYVPLDPLHPAERLRFILADAAVPVLLTQHELLVDLPADGLTRVNLDTDWPSISRQSAAPLADTATADHLAYVLYTSGSTGRPKGTLVQHRSLLNYLTWCSNAYHVAAGSGALVHSSIAFDLTITGLFAPLLVGRAVHLVSDELGVEALSEALRRSHDLSLVKITPAHLELLAQQLPPQEAAGRTGAFIIGGENLLAQRLRFWQSAAPETLLINEYGPTETVVGCCVYRVPPEAHIDGAVPIGQPIANTQLYVLDAQFNLVPFGQPGELYIGGAGVARGYLNQPALTAARFVPDPWSRVAGARLYRSGDLVRYQADGNLVFLGRIDDQVKIRGYRVEPGEIAVVLEQHPQVQQAVVLARENSSAELQLVGYVVGADAAAPDGGTLRDYLRTRLPEYMIPSAWVAIDQLPLTANGKVDQTALRAIDQPSASSKAKFVAPRTPIEHTLAEIWQQLLRIDTVGVDDDFFDVGGDSILSFQLIARARRAGFPLTIKQVFETRTVARMALLVAAPAATIVAEQGIVTGEVPLTPVQHWFFEQDLADPQHYNQALLLTVPPAVDVDVMEQAVQQLWAHHDALRLRFVRDAAGWRQSYAGLDNPLQIARFDLSPLPDDQCSPKITTIAGEIQASLSLEHGPLARLAFFDLGARPGRLLLVIHHLAIDGVSWRILLEDVQTVYQQLSAGTPVQLPPKTTSFQQWAYELAAYAGTTAQHELAYWRRAVPADVRALPLDRPAPRAQTEATTRTVVRTLGVEATRALLQELPTRQQAQITEFLLTALQRAIATWSGAETVLVDLEGHGREDVIADVDVSRTVGWFTTIYPVALRTSAGCSVAETLDSVKQQLRQVPQRGLSYGLLRYGSDDTVGADLAARPQAEISFNYLGQLDQVLDGSALLTDAPESAGPLRSPRALRRYLLDVVASVTGGQLEFIWHYSDQLHERATIERLAEDALAVLRAMIALPPATSVTDAPAPSLMDDRSLLVAFETGDRRCPFFCVHPSGGLVLVYNDLSRALGSDQPFYAIQPLGLDPAQPMDTVVEVMAARYVRALRSVQPHGPYALGGWSGGAIIAFEMAQQLIAADEQVGLLALFDQGTPDPDGWMWDDATLLASVFGRDAEQVLAHLRHRSPDEQLAYVLKQAQQGGVLPAEMSLVEIRHFLTIYKTTNAALRAYRPRPYASQITLFRATHQPPGPKQDDPSLGWSTFAPGRVEVCHVPGDHYSIMHTPDVLPVVSKLEAYLTALPPAASGD